MKPSKEDKYWAREEYKRKCRLRRIRSRKQRNEIAALDSKFQFQCYIEREEEIARVGISAYYAMKLNESLNRLGEVARNFPRGGIIGEPMRENEYLIYTVRRTID